MSPGAFFSPGLDPVLNRGIGDEDAMVSSEMPTGGTAGPTVLNHDPHCQGDDMVRVVAAGGAGSDKSALKYVRHVVQ